MQLLGFEQHGQQEVKVSDICNAHWMKRAERPERPLLFGFAKDTTPTLISVKNMKLKADTHGSGTHAPSVWY